MKCDICDRDVLIDKFDNHRKTHRNDAAELALLRKALESVNPFVWHSPETYVNRSVCAWCANYEEQGHAADCKYAAAMKARKDAR